MSTTTNLENTDESEKNKDNNDWKKFGKELGDRLLIVFVFVIVGSKCILYATSNMKDINSEIPTNLNKPPYCGAWEDSTETSITNYFNLNKVNFPYKYNSIPNELLTVSALDKKFYILWPLKWLSGTTAWAWSTWRILEKSFINVLQIGYGTPDINEDNSIKYKPAGFNMSTIIFILAPLAILSLAHFNIQPTIALILMYMGGFRSNVPHGWFLATFAIMVTLIAIAYGISLLAEGCKKLSKMCNAVCAGLVPWKSGPKAVADMGGEFLKSSSDAVGEVAGNIFTFGQKDKISKVIDNIPFGSIGAIFVIVLAIVSVSFSGFWNSTNSLLMYLQFSVLFLLKPILNLFTNESERKKMTNVMSKKVYIIMFLIIGAILTAAKETLDTSINKGLMIGCVISTMSVLAYEFIIKKKN